MKVELLDTELFIKANNLRPVTNPVILNRGSVPTSDGLLSTEIFGITPKERKTTFAYIDLRGWFLQPIVYKQIKRMDRRIDSIISGSAKYTINNEGQLIEDPEGETGLDWLYNNWEKIKFNRNESNIRSERIDLLENNKKNVLFTRFWIVEPAFYRDINLQKIGSGKPSLHEINVGSDETNGASYSKLLRLVSSMKSSGDFVFALNNTKYQIQLCMIGIYDYFKSRIEKKYGIIKKGVLGKSIDYGSRLVISASHNNTERYDEMIVDSTHCGLPLANCISNATPFFVGWLNNFFRREFEASENKYPVIDPKTGELKYVALKNPAAFFNDDYCTNLMKKFIYSYSQRFDPIELPTVDGDTCYIAFKGKLAEPSSETIESKASTLRYMTLTDLMYLAAVDIYANRHVIITRYPITSFQSLYPIKVQVLSTMKTCKMNVNGRIYRFYPVIDVNLPQDKVATQFIEVLMMQNTYLQTLDADYDGDQVSVRTVFSQEANAECDRLCKEPTNYLSANGTNVRTSEKESVQTLYALTKD